MNKTLKSLHMPGTSSTEMRAYEVENRVVARKAAQEGIVLLKNEDAVLPLSKGCSIALYGAGASQTIIGGTGSGDVNKRESISVYQGLKDAGITIATRDWLADFDRIYEESRQQWKTHVLKAAEEMEEKGSFMAFFEAYSNNPYAMPAGQIPEKAEADTAVYVISRVAGEGKDRCAEPGDYYLSESEEEMLEQICSLYESVIVLINSGSIIDLQFMDRYQNIKGLVLISQPGMEGGNAVADVLTGKVTPSGKLTDSWAIKYENYPSSELFSHNSGDVEKEYYTEGIYVGYRYFDTFDIPVRFSFGYGLSYTEFSIDIDQVRGFALKREDARLVITGRVKNTGERYSGKEVVQIYVSCPQGRLEKEYRRLVGYHKTKELAPQEEETFILEIPVYQLASYDEQLPGWILESGVYGIFAGNSLENASYIGSMSLEEDKTLIHTQKICPLQEELEELKASANEVEKKRKVWLSKINDYPQVKIAKDDLVSRRIEYGTSASKITEEARNFVDSLTEEQLILLATGDVGKAQGSALGAAGISIPGSAAQTSECALENGLPGVVLADGPAGLRLQREYYVKNNEIIPLPFQASLEGGFLMKEEDYPEGEKRYQYCTAFPIGTMLAQSWNEELVQEVGQAVAKEMEEFQITFWLAPGLNIHRNPLCGRNFEYYSEDAYMSGRIAAAMTNGVQKTYGCGTTIKHFACNNQEDNRMGSDSIVSERALREIYLKGFEIAVKSSQPFSIMTSYNLINGIHAANCHDICTKVARDEWDFHGVIMTDWTTTTSEGCTAAGCIRAGNDLIMPGSNDDHENLRKELKEGKLSIDELKNCIARFVQIAWKSNQVETLTGNAAVDRIRREFYLGDRIRDAGLIDPVGMKTQENISYGPYGKWNLLDIYRRNDAAGKQPVIVNMHGGGWSYGDKELYRYYCMELANRGFAVVNYNYRLAPEYRFPAGIEDTNAVFTWLVQHAEEYELDLNNVFVTGDSAGGQMASQYAALMTNEDYRKHFEFDVPYGKVSINGVALNCGIYDMKNAKDELFRSYVGKALIEDPETTVEKIDVCKYITKDYPPAYIMTASYDFLKEMAEPMADLLASKGVEVEYHLYGDETQEYMSHVFHCNIRLREAIICNDDECDFFKNHICE